MTDFLHSELSTSRFFLFGKRVECSLGAPVPLVGDILKTDICRPYFLQHQLLLEHLVQIKIHLVTKGTLIISIKHQGILGVEIFFFNCGKVHIV